MLFFRQYYLGCLSHASYLIGDTGTGRAVVVDPQRDVAGYLEDARTEGLTVERVIETHFHADFVSGHLELATAVGATISFGAAAEGRTVYAIDPLPDGRRLELGEVVLEVRATPGHTPESISVVVWEHADDEVPYGVLTGDTLFIGDVGRPDLLVSAGVSADELARSLYRSLHERLLTLPDATRVFPAHGAGSACGKHLSTETVSTIGEQRRTNYALAPMSEDRFVEVVTEGQPAAPMYFPFAAHLNTESHELLGDTPEGPSLDIGELHDAVAEGATIVDTRDPAIFATAHLDGAINVGLEGRFAEYVGQVVAAGSPIVLVTDGGAEVQAQVRLARIGFDNVVGVLSDPERVFFEHPKLAVRSSRLSAAELHRRLTELDELQLVDVRAPGEVASGTLDGAVNIPLTELLGRLGELDPEIPTVVFCAGGYRSSIAASTLAAHGFEDVSDVLGGFGALVPPGGDGQVRDEPAGPAVDAGSSSDDS